MTDNQPGMASSEDLLTVLLEEYAEEMSVIGLDASHLTSVLRMNFYIDTHAEHNEEMAAIASWQDGIREQIKAEVAVENGTYVDPN